MNGRRNVIISGGCGGVGSAIGRALAADGFSVTALYFSTPREKAEELIKSLASENGQKHAAIQCDLRDEAAVSAIVDRVAGDGGLHACIHAAVDPILRKELLDVSGEELEAQLSTDLFGGLAFMGAAARAMKAAGNGGAIIGILSRVIYPDTFYPKMASYTVGKFGAWALLKSLSHELADTGITVNGITPNIMDTKLSGDLPEPVRKFMVERAPGGSVRTPEDVAKIAAFLCSPEGAKVTGKIYSFEPSEVKDL